MKVVAIWGDDSLISVSGWEVLRLSSSSSAVQVLAATAAQPTHVLAICPSVSPDTVRTVRRLATDLPFLLLPGACPQSPIDVLSPAVRGTLDPANLGLAEIRRRQVPQHKPTVFFSPRGGCGTSTLVAAVAFQLAHWHEPTLLVDLNLHHPDLADFLSSDDTGIPSPTLEQFLKDPNLVPGTIQGHSEVGLVPGLGQLENLDYVNVEGVEGLLGRFANRHVLVDTSSYLADPATYAALRMAGPVIIVIDGRRSSRVHVTRYRRTMLQLGLPWEEFLFVLNRYTRGHPLSPAEIGEDVGLEPFVVLPEVPGLDRTGIVGAMGHKLQSSVERLAAHLVGRPLKKSSYPVSIGRGRRAER